MLNATWFVLGGMAIVFAVLALLLGAMMALNRWLRPEVETAAQGKAGSSNPKSEGHGRA